jgi:hypothetical protein
MGNTPKRNHKRTDQRVSARSATPKRVGTPRCDRCGAVVMEIDMIVDSVRLNMRACGSCDLRTWRRDGEVHELRDVLDEIDATHTRYRRDYASI